MKQPPGLSKLAKGYWMDVKEITKGNDIQFNPTHLSQYCETYATWRDALDSVREHGSVIKQGGKVTESPFQIAADKAERKLAHLLSRFQSVSDEDLISVEDDVRLNTKMKLFIREYPIDNNGSKAAIRAGYSEQTAKQQATFLLSKEHIRLHIARVREQIARDINLSHEDVLQGFLLEARGLGPDTSSTARNQAWTSIAKHLGFFGEDNAQRAAGLQGLIDKLPSADVRSLEKAVEREIQRKQADTQQVAH